MEEKWKLFEQECLRYLNKEFSSCEFKGHGGADSTVSDIEVFKSGKPMFYIESKCPMAQSGQFVLKQDDEKREFLFSGRNKSPKELASDIIAHMNSDYEKYSNPGTSGNVLDIPSDLMYDWVTRYYTDVKKVKYFISKHNNVFVICPISNIKGYFDISATYRIKKSGSSNPSSTNYDEIRNTLREFGFEFGEIEENGNCRYIEIRNLTENRILRAGTARYAYQFKLEENNLFEIKRLSNTANANVIFSLTCKSDQKKDDLELFKKDVLC